MAIAFDASAQKNVEIGITSQTQAHTCTGSNRLLAVWVMQSKSGDNSDYVTGVTYNGTAMSRILTVIHNSSNRVYLYALLAPSTGANNIVVSYSTSVNANLISCSYTGVSQSGLPDSSNSGTAASTTTITVSTTTVATDCWLIGGIRSDENDQGGTISAGSNTYLRKIGDNENYYMIDSNADQGAPGSKSMNVTGTQTWVNMTMGIMSVAPAVADLDINLNDSVTVAEAITMDNLSLGDISVNDAVTITESVTVDLPLEMSISDSVTVSESITMDNSSLGDVAVNDAVTVAESITMDNSSLGDINVNDAVTVTESVTADAPLDISVNDSVTLVESLTISNSDLGGISVNDAVTISESLTMLVGPARSGYIAMLSNQQDRPVPLDSNQQSRPVPLDDSRNV